MTIAVLIKRRRDLPLSAAKHAFRQKCPEQPRQNQPIDHEMSKAGALEPSHQPGNRSKCTCKRKHPGKHCVALKRDVPGPSEVITSKKARRGGGADRER